MSSDARNKSFVSGQNTQDGIENFNIRNLKKKKLYISIFAIWKKKLCIWNVKKSITGEYAPQNIPQVVKKYINYE